MKQNIIEYNDRTIAEIISDGPALNTVQDSLDIMAGADYAGARSIVLHEDAVDPSFFDLKTGFAGEVLQKYANYSMKLAVVGDFEKHTSESFRAFVRECNRGSTVFFVPDLDTALEKITGS